MKKFKCQFNFVNNTNGVSVQVYFILESFDKFKAEKIAVVKACEELKELKNYALTYYKISDDEQTA